MCHVNFRQITFGVYPSSCSLDSHHSQIDDQIEFSQFHVALLGAGSAVQSDMDAIAVQSYMDGLSSRHGYGLLGVTANSPGVNFGCMRSRR